jgi:hypothetical protein
MSTSRKCTLAGSLCLALAACAALVETARAEQTRYFTDYFCLSSGPAPQGTCMLESQCNQFAFYCMSARTPGECTEGYNGLTCTQVTNHDCGPAARCVTHEITFAIECGAVSYCTS